MENKQYSINKLLLIKFDTNVIKGSYQANIGSEKVDSLFSLKAFSFSIVMLPSYAGLGLQKDNPNKRYSLVRLLFPITDTHLSIEAFSGLLIPKIIIYVLTSVAQQTVYALKTIFNHCHLKGATNFTGPQYESIIQHELYHLVTEMNELSKLPTPESHYVEWFPQQTLSSVSALDSHQSDTFMMYFSYVTCDLSALVIDNNTASGYTGSQITRGNESKKV